MAGWQTVGERMLMSQTTFLQKESIPAISHLVELAAPEEQNGGNT